MGSAVREGLNMWEHKPNYVVQGGGCEVNKYADRNKTLPHWNC